ncbi:hypothetical protein DFH06DRAFT_1323787 [Mycena polygramma]|nr:hypothetical protein DFH06DRAFT_1323787 [Mycena polygramma]
MEEVDDEEIDAPRISLPRDCPHVLILESEYNAGLQSPDSTNHPRRVTVEEIVDEDRDAVPLPSLPWDHPFVLLPESEFSGTECPAESPGRIDDTESDEAEEPVATPITITFGLLDRPMDSFREDTSHPSAVSMPGLKSLDRVSLSSKQSQVSAMGDDDPHGLFEEALEEAVAIIQLRSARFIEKAEAEQMAEDESPKRLHELRARWFDVCADLMGPIPLQLPPLREINHEINLIDEQAVYNYHLPRCPEALRPELRAKIQRYTEAGWWEMTPVPQAAPLLCIPKKDYKLRTVVDARQRNDNTVKDVTPFPRSRWD